jgi:hypothetical protein
VTRRGRARGGKAKRRGARIGRKKSEDKKK